MAKQTINIGASVNDGTGDPLRTAFDKINDNFDELYLFDSNVAGDDTQVLFNDGEAFGADTDFTYNKTTNALTVTGNVTGGNLVTSGLVSAGNVTATNLTIAGNVTGDLTATGNITGGNLSGTSIIGTLTTATQTNITSVGTLLSLVSTGNVTGGNLTTGAQVVATGNITTTGGYFIGDGSELTGITASAAPAGADTNIQFNDGGSAGGVAQFTFNKVGNALTVTGNISGGNVSGTTITGNLSATGNIIMASNNINGLADPIQAQDAATKTYVDTIAAAGLHYHDPVRVESETALSATYDNGSSGVGATLTNNGAQAAIQIDGITLNVNDRVLVYQQSNAAHNGVYKVTDTGSVSTNWELTRTTDADSYGPSDSDALGEGDAFFVQEGAAGAGELYVMATSGTITFGTTNITFSQINSAQIYSGTNGVDLTGVTFSLDSTYSPTFAGITLPNITKNGTNNVGNIGQSDNAFNVIHAQATSAQYADLAEKYTTDHEYEAGTVVVFGGNSEITQSTVSHDRKVAGVISTNPAVKMNDGIDGQYLALQGRVPTRVLGPIEKGDLVVTSNIAGVGEKLDDAQYYPGCVIGKALESITDNAQQVIEVVVGRL